ncbi:UNVERIFIED_CONTAM: hypothetical protein K2H54_024422 [Gekko kuhli]
MPCPLQLKWPFSRPPSSHAEWLVAVFLLLLRWAQGSDALPIGGRFEWAQGGNSLPTVVISSEHSNTAQGLWGYLPTHFHPQFGFGLLRQRHRLTGITRDQGDHPLDIRPDSFSGLQQQRWQRRWLARVPGDQGYT